MDLYYYKRKFIGNLALAEIAPCYPNEAMPPILTNLYITDKYPVPPRYWNHSTDYLVRTVGRYVIAITRQVSLFFARDLRPTSRYFCFGRPTTDKSDFHLLTVAYQIYKDLLYNFTNNFKERNTNFSVSIHVLYMHFDLKSRTIFKFLTQNLFNSIHR